MENAIIDNAAMFQKNIHMSDLNIVPATLPLTHHRQKRTVVDKAIPSNANPVVVAVTLPRSLKHIKESIDKSRFILDLTTNWDDNGALPVSKAVYSNAVSFLKKYVLFISTDLGTIISAPDINPVKDGSIDLEWHTPHTRMLINVKTTGEIAYYGDNYSDVNSIKGKVSSDTIQKFLAVWMTKLA
jgi:hypothetical protein